jgi:hypothetical protein
MNEPGDKLHYFNISIGSFVELENDDIENELVLQDGDLKQVNSDHTPLYAPLSNSNSSNLSLRRSKRQHKINEFYTRDYVPSEDIGYYGQIYGMYRVYRKKGILAICSCFFRPENFFQKTKF